VSRYQKKHSPTHHPDHHPIFISIFWILMVQGKITEVDTPTVQLGATPSELISEPPPSSPHFYARCRSCHNPPNLSWLGTGTGICWIAHPMACFFWLFSICTSVRLHISAVMGLYECILIHSYELFILVCAQPYSQRFSFGASDEKAAVKWRWWWWLRSGIPCL